MDMVGRKFLYLVDFPRDFCYNENARKGRGLYGLGWPGRLFFYLLQGNEGRLEYVRTAKILCCFGFTRYVYSRLLPIYSHYTRQGGSVVLGISPLRISTMAQGTREDDFQVIVPS